jgi:hypothetical protein
VQDISNQCIILHQREVANLQSKNKWYEVSWLHNHQHQHTTQNPTDSCHDTSRYL